MAQADLFATVCKVLIKLSQDPTLEVESIKPETNVLGELGLTSLTLVDLSLALEAALRLDEFPLQDWIDAENKRGMEGFRVASIVETCEQRMLGAS